MKNELISSLSSSSSFPLFLNEIIRGGSFEKMPLLRGPTGGQTTFRLFLESLFVSNDLSYSLSVRPEIAGMSGMWQLSFSTSSPKRDDSSLIFLLSLRSQE